MALRTRVSLTATKSGMELHRDRTYELEFKSTHDCKDWTGALLQAIKHHENTAAVRKEGWLEKRGLLNTDWARRW